MRIFYASGGGEICPAPVDERGYTRVAAEELARHIEQLFANFVQRAELANCGRRAWRERFIWETIAQDYEALFSRLVGVGVSSGG